MILGGPSGALDLAAMKNSFKISMEGLAPSPGHVSYFGTPWPVLSALDQINWPGNPPPTLIYDPAVLSGRNLVCALNSLRPGWVEWAQDPKMSLPINGTVVSGPGRGMLNQRKLKIKIK